MTDRSKLRRTLSEYFLGTDTREFLENQIHRIKGSSAYGEYADVLIYLRDDQRKSHYFSNVRGLIISGIFLGGYLFTKDSSNILYGGILLAVSETTRFVGRLTKKGKDRLEERFDISVNNNSKKRLYNESEILDTLEDHDKINPGYDENGIDTSGYDGWYLPEGDD